MTLRQRAEQAARAAIARWDEDSDGTPTGFRKHIADAIERVAKEFAEQALYAIGNGNGDNWTPDDVAAAIADAEKE